MKQRYSRSSPGAYKARMLFLITLFLALLAVDYTALWIPLEDTQLRHTPPTTYNDGWAVQNETRLQSLWEPSRPAAGRPEGELTLVNTLPAAMPTRTTLSFQTKNESVLVCVDSVPVYSYGDVPQLIYGHGLGAVHHLIPLPDDCSGKTISIRLTPVDQRTGLAPYAFLLGGRDAIITNLLQRQFPLLLVSLALGVISLTAFVMYFVSLRRNPGQTGVLLYFALFSLMSAVWTAADSGLLQFILPSKGAAYLLFGSSFYLLPSPFALLMAMMIPEKAKLFRCLSAIYSGYALVRILLFVLGIMNFETGLWTLHLMIGGMIFFSDLYLWLPVIRTKRWTNRAQCLAITALTLVAFYSLVSFYLQDKLDVRRNGYASGFYWGILLYVIFTIIGAAKNMAKLKQKAFKAAFFEQRAYTDELTGLLNVKGFDDKCAALLPTVPASRCCALVDFDVNFFSQFNANNGLNAGDALLMDVAATLRSCCLPGELAARQEADHFVCLLMGESLSQILSRIRTADDGARVNLSAAMLLLSYGVVEVTDRAISPAALRNQAVVAKRTVKGNYEHNIAVYDSALHQSQLLEMSLLAGFEEALVREEYVIYLQPKVNAVTEQICGAEALVRHITPDGTITPAGTIIEALERKGFVAKLDYYILNLVCRFLRRCLDQGRAVVPVSSNFSRVHLYDGEFARRVGEIVDSYALPHSLVEIELTETAFLAGKDALRDTAQRLHKLGFAVAVDDFGSGYSSLNVLKDVEVDAVKIDREFLSDFVENRRAEMIVEHTVQLAQQLGITSIAEGVETAEQLSFLRRLSCEQIQGFYFSRPLPEETFIEKYCPIEKSDPQ